MASNTFPCEDPMTASDTTATNKKGSPEPGFDKTAQRILNLFFVLNSSP